MVNTAIIPLMMDAGGLFDKDMAIGKGLDELAKIVEGKGLASNGS